MRPEGLPWWPEPLSEQFTEPPAMQETQETWV